jgi:seryl-tRNA synthetase
VHDIAFIRRDRDAWVAALARRPAYAETASSLADDILARDKELRDWVTRLQTAQARRNEASKLIGQAKAKKDEAQASALIEEVALLKGEIQENQEAQRKEELGLRKLIADLPNLPASDVPDGIGEDDNVEVRERAFGERPTLNSAAEHYELGEALGMMDFDRAARVAGARFVYLKKGLARLERAIANYMLDLHTGEFGYTEVQPPLLVRGPAMYGTGQLPKFEEDLFVVRGRIADKMTREEREEAAFQAGIATPLSEMTGEQLLRLYYQSADNRYLIPTAEVSLTNYVREEILDEESLPRRYTAWTPCFRAEAGAAGKDTRGMIRMHQFSKVELVSITTPEKSEEEHERMTDCAQAVLKRLNLHHRVMTLCAGDMGFAAKKTYDIEVWLPGQERFREISSCSNCGEFQARRMNARYRPKNERSTRFVHTLNGSGLAVGRTLIAIMENYQNPDGSIAIPDALLPYMGSLKKIEKQ